jgi:diguanylate cyclase (GGDEF)-like protein
LHEKNSLKQGRTMRSFIKKLTGEIQTIEDRLTVRMQIAVAVAAMTVLLVGSLAAGAAFVSYRTTSTLVNSKLASIAATTADRLDRFMSMKQREMYLFSQLEPLRHAWQNNPVTLRLSLEQLQSAFPDFAWIGFVNPEGTVIASTRGLLEGASVGKRPWFKDGLDGLSVGDVHEATLLSKLLEKRSDGEPHRFVDISLPIRDSGGKTIGVLGAHLNWDWARRLLDSAESTDGGANTTLSVVSKEGAVLLGPDHGKIRYAGPKLAKMLQTGDGMFAATERNEPTLTAFFVGKGYADYEGLNWIVTASQPASVALAAAISSAQTIIAIGAVTGLIGVCLAFLIARRISRPIRVITEEADRIGRAAGSTMLPRQAGSVEVVQLTRALRSLLRRVGFAEERTREAEFRASENALQFKEDISKLRQIADTDHLTGLMNRRAFLVAAEDAMDFCHRYKRSMATLMIDIDHFKKINDTHGHAAGDGAIKRVAEIIGDCIRTTDKAARFGGEEFVVLLREVDRGTAVALAERIRSTLQSSTIGYGSLEISVTVSVGIAIVNETDRDVQDMIERADQGLYLAKNTGRNRTFFMPASNAAVARAA